MGRRGKGKKVGSSAYVCIDGGGDVGLVGFG